MNSFFLLAEDDVSMDSLELVSEIEEINNLLIQGFIFLKDLTIESYLLCEDLDFSPALIVKGNLSAPNMYFCGMQLKQKCVQNVCNGK